MVNMDNFETEDDLSPYKIDSNKAVTFNIIYDADKTLVNNLSFKPEMSHQIFGENESIFGYRSLLISLNYLHNSSRCYVHIESSGEIQSSVHKPDDIMQSLSPWLPENFITDEQQFTNMIKSEKHDLIYGDIVYEYISKEKSPLFSDVEVYPTIKITRGDLKNEDFKEFHARFETFVIWFIDGANYIDLDDEKWEIFYAYEEVKHPKTQQLYVTPVGYCTVYKFFAYPDKIRSRISQFLILPAYQKLGIGTNLYKTVFKLFQSMEEVIDITVEEPTQQFQKLRDIQDCIMLDNVLREKEINIVQTHKKKVFNEMRKLKLCQKQLEWVYHILHGFKLKSNPEMYKNFMKDVKGKKLTKCLKGVKPGKMFKSLNGLNLEKQATEEMDNFERQFREFEENLHKSIISLKTAL